MLFTKLPQAVAVFTAVDVAGAKFDYNLEGLGEAMPRLQKILRFADAADAGLPPFPGFFGRLLIIIACLQSFNFSVALVAAVLALVIFALLLNMEMRTFRGKPTLDISSIGDISRWQVFLLASTIMVLFILGLISPWLVEGWQEIILQGG
jgi:NADH:ubiquinone oxidoreductase subunit 4 (subunit M)